MARQRKKAFANKRHPTPDSLRRSLTREREQRKEALERERATSEILRVIAESQTDVQPVFDTIVRNAVSLCGGMFANAYRYDGEQLHLVATTHKSVEALKILADMYPRRPDERQAAGRAIVVKATVKIDDVLADSTYDHRYAIAGSWRRVLAVPMLRSGEPIGVIVVAWAKPGPVSQRQEQLLQTFADQAVIAIENVRLFNETKEALEHQKASADILKIVAGSVDNTDPVFKAITEAGMRLVPGCRVALNLLRDGQLQHVAHSGAAAEHWQKVSPFFPIAVDGGGVPSAKAVAEKRVVHVPDIEKASGEFELGRKIAQASGWRSIVSVPLMRAGEAIGSIAITRVEPEPFTDKQIALAQTFADQAVIAIENARLFNETKEALERQTATSEILRVISSSPADLQPVFDTIARNFIALCGAAFGGVYTYDGRLVHLAGVAGLRSEQERRTHRAKYPVGVDDSSVVSARTIRARAPVHVEDALSDAHYDPERAKRLGVRRLLGVPMLREGEPLGALVAGWSEAGPTPKQHEELLRTFADQAAIAIQNVRLFNETKEALERQTATADILGVISRSPSDIEPVLQAVAERAALLCEATDVHIRLVQGELMPPAVQVGSIPVHEESKVQRITRESVPGRAILECRTIHIHDIQQPEVRSEYPEALFHRRPDPGFRTILVVPLVRGAAAIGSITVRRAQMRPFSEQQTKLLQIFAEQAVIAIENVRLFNETKEALERQTATAEILGVISSTPSDVQPVFDVIVKSALRLLEGHSAVVTRIEGEFEHLGAYTSTSPSGDERVRSMYPRPVSRSGGAGTRAIATGKPNMIADYESDPTILETARETARLRGYRSSLVVPMLREGTVTGTIRVTRKVAGSFPDHHVRLLQTFADQAVIAIENVRLFKELQATNSTLREALEQQTASADILKAISGSPTYVQPVFDTIVRNAVRLGNAAVGFLISYDGTTMQLAAQYNVDSEQDSVYRPAFPRPAAPDTMTGRSILDRAVINLADIESSDFGRGPKERARRAGYRSALVVPMLRSGVPIGVLNIQRREAGAFADSYVSLLKTFADQAVIAIENARLFNETKEALERQTATADILKVIAASPADVQPVFDAIIRRASALSGGCSVNVSRLVGDQLHLAAYTPVSPEADELLRGLYPIPATVARPLSEAVRRKAPFFVSDFENDPGISQRAREVMRARGFRSTLYVPIMRGDVVHGVMHVSKVEPGPFEQKWIDLLQTFADQAVIAIENVRLFKELQERTEALTKSVDQLTALGEVGQAISSTLDLQTVLKTIVQRAVQLGGLHGGSIYEFDERDDRFHLRAAEHVEEEIREVSRRSPIRLGEGAVGRAGATREPVVVEDVLDESYQSRVRELLIKSGSRAVLAVPLLREDLLLGALAVSRKSPGPFAPEVIDLLKTFATQSAVAIQNARLFNETKEALDQQKASAEVLAAISSSIADTTPVFEKILESCQRLFAGRNVGINVVGDDGNVHLGAYHGGGREEFEKVYPLPLDRNSGTGLAVLERRVLHYPDAADAGVPDGVRKGCATTGVMACILAPLLWEGRGLGAIFVGRDHVGEFSDKEIALLRTFADQAAIAIQNARLFREIQEKSAQLEVASQHKSQFLASMSHELRTPLNAILGFNEMILDDVYGPVSAEVKSALEEMQGSGKHLLRLINNVLDLAKIEAGRMELALADYSVQDTVESVRSTLRPVAAEKRLELVTSLPSDLPLARGDAGRISQCLLNLAGNALKFTKEGKVEIGVTLDNGQLVYRVADTGIGIPADKIGSLFTEFKQSDATIASEYGGTGLGLSITKKFIEMHGGRIWVESEPGKGSTFTFEVPLRA